MEPILWDGFHVMFLFSHLFHPLPRKHWNEQGKPSQRMKLRLGNEGLPAVKLLQERFGTPYVYGFPLSYGSEERFYQEIAQYLPWKDAFYKGEPLSPEGQRNLLQSYGKMAVYASYDVLLAMEELGKELGMEIAFLLCTHSLKGVENPSPQIRICNSEKEKIQLFQGLENTVVIGEDTFFSHVNDSCGCVSLSRQSEGVTQLLSNPHLLR